MGRGSGAGLVFGWGVSIETDGLLLAPGGSLGLVVAGADACLGHRLTYLQQTLRANDDTIVGDELLIADVQLFTAFRTSPAHDFLQLIENS